MMRFALYGYNEVTKEVIRITREESVANVTVNGVYSKIYFFDEMKKFLSQTKSETNIYLDKFLRKPKTGVARVSRNVKLLAPKCKGVNVFAFGWDKDMEKAEDILNDILQLDKQQKPVNQTNLYSLAEAYLRQSRIVADRKKTLDFMKEVLLDCDDGEVFTNGSSMYAVLIGLQYGGYGPDTEKMKAVPSIWKNYTYETEPAITIKVDDGIKKPREPKVPTDRKSYSDAEIFDMANSYNTDAQLLYGEEESLEELRKLMLEKFPIGEKDVYSGTRKINVKITKADHGVVRPDVNKMKRDSQVWNDYTKRKSDTRLLTIKNLNQKEVVNV